MSKRQSAFGNDDDDDNDVKPKQTIKPFISFSSAPSTTNNINLKSNSNSNNKVQSSVKKSRFNNDDDDDDYFSKDTTNKKQFIPPFVNIPTTITTPTNKEDDEGEEAYRDEQQQQHQQNNSNKQQQQQNEDEDDEIDPLDAFMENVNAQAAIEHSKSIEKNQNQKQEKFQSKRDDIDNEDDEEIFYKLRQKQLSSKQQPSSSSSSKQQTDDDDDDIDYSKLDDNDDLDDEESLKNQMVKGKRIIEPLPPIDHSKENYIEFNKYFYEEHQDISSLSDEKVFEIRKDLDIRINGNELVNPVTSFGHYGFDDILLQAIAKQSIETPTPIQKQAIPIALSGRDLIAIAKTGSGKTATFIWPSISHIMDQPYLEKGDGPIALFLAPTRELAHQIYLETLKYSKYYKLRTSVLYGGVSKQQQCKELKAGCEIIVSTPGRLIDMIKLKATKLNRVSYLVLDEADKMFDFGFGPQVLSIVNHVRPDRQTLLFSATFKQNVEDFARTILLDPIRISIGNIGSANSDITQIVQVLKSESEKWNWLMNILPSLLSQGSVLIFVSTKVAVDQLSGNLNKYGFTNCSLHGDKNQIERSQTISTYKEGKIKILIATDVAARGLDIALIKNVINFDPSRDIESHTHRIGRTGRAGAQGTAFTLVTPKDIHFSVDLIKNLESANQFIPPELITIAMNNNYFKRERGSYNNRGGSRGGRGGGFRRNGRGGGNSSGNSSSRGGFNSSNSRGGFNSSNSGNRGGFNNSNNNSRGGFSQHGKVSFVPAQTFEGGKLDNHHKNNNHNHPQNSNNNNNNNQYNHHN